MRALSADLRERVVSAHQQGLSTGQIAERFSVASSTVRKLCTQQRTVGHVQPLPRPTRAQKLAPYRALIEKWIAEERGLRLIDIADRIEAQSGIRVGLSTVHETLVSWRITFKKRR